MISNKGIVFLYTCFIIFFNILTYSTILNDQAISDSGLHMDAARSGAKPIRQALFCLLNEFPTVRVKKLRACKDLSYISIKQ